MIETRKTPNWVRAYSLHYDVDPALSRCSLGGSFAPSHLFSVLCTFPSVSHLYFWKLSNHYRPVPSLIPESVWSPDNSWPASVSRCERCADQSDYVYLISSVETRVASAICFRAHGTCFVFIPLPISVSRFLRGLGSRRHRMGRNVGSGESVGEDKTVTDELSLEFMSDQLEP